MSVDLEVYCFAMGTTKWNYTTANDSITVDGVLYSVMPGLSRSAIEQTGEAARAGITVTMPRAKDPASQWANGMPEGIITLAIKRRVSNAWKFIWSGRILGCGYKGISAEFTCEPWFTATKVQGLRQTFSAMCPHEFCDYECSLTDGPNPDNWTAAGTVTGLTGLTLTLAAAANFPDGTLTGGILSCGGFKRKVTQHTGVYVTLSKPLSTLGVGSFVSILAGCDKSPATCATRNNIKNYGGWPNIPAFNPTSGSPIL